MCGLGLIGAGSKDKNVSKVMDKTLAGTVYRKTTNDKLSDDIKKQDKKVKNLF